MRPASGESSSQCVKAPACPGGTDTLCNTGEDPENEACGNLTCDPGRKAAAFYGLPGAPFGVCE